MLKKIILIMIITSLTALNFSCQEQTKYISVSAGTTLQPLLDDANAMFTKQYGINIKIQYLCMAMVLSSVMLTEEADVIFSGSEYYMDKAVAANIIHENKQYPVGELVPVITTPKGNPKNITKLEDFLNPGVKLGFADFDNLATGRLTRAILVKEGLFDKVKSKIEYNAVSPAKLQTVISLGHLDATINSLIEVQRFKETCEIYNIPENQLLYSVNCCAITSYSKKKDWAKKYVEFIGSEQVRSLLKDRGYCLPDNIDRTKITKVN